MKRHQAVSVLAISLTLLTTAQAQEILEASKTGDLARAKNLVEGDRDQPGSETA
jgi:hypothetical protein